MTRSASCGAVVGAAGTLASVSPDMIGIGEGGEDGGVPSDDMVITQRSLSASSGAVVVAAVRLGRTTSVDDMDIAWRLVLPLVPSEEIVMAVMRGGGVRSGDTVIPHRLVSPAALVVLGGVVSPDEITMICRLAC